MHAIFISLLLVTGAAVLSHVSVRYSRGVPRLFLFVLILTLLSIAFDLGQVFGGSWSGIYTLLSAYFLACILMPLLDIVTREFWSAFHSWPARLACKFGRNARNEDSD